ncbi:hypothetical protein BFP72_00825 [Reichenbachiella sp. 5M10]|uniref:redoxin family protein n=1 Tax=Reichenbachiella sp. 5M10 TaxID=1889772 RepID=UPI000C5D238B|nr:redoxin family protein [Reichenbachiella sp. 5M10]PIB34072.1 hypothetical protein BFP72_00825 [Reichenbachiella sp. 5M10]
MKSPHANYKKTIGLTFALLLWMGIHMATAQEIQVIKYEELNQIIQKQDGKTRVINFWATWCAPCVKELPQFEALYEKYKNKNTEVILVSMDFADQLDAKVKKFAAKKNLKSTLYLLDETDYNSFIDKIDPAWSGAIPATLMIRSKTNTRIFIEKEFKEGELEKVYLNFIN